MNDIPALPRMRTVDEVYGSAFAEEEAFREADGSWIVRGSAAQAAELADVLMRAASGTAAHGEPVLPGLPGSRLLYSGHDDCYLTVESADPSVPTALLSRLLALLAGSALAGASPAEVPEPADALVTSLIGDNAHWTGMLGSVSENTVTVSLTATAEPWRLGQKLPERIDRLAICDMRHGSWRLAAAHGC